jgi:hypothetical protein
MGSKLLSTSPRTKPHIYIGTSPGDVGTSSKPSEVMHTRAFPLGSTRRQVLYLLVIFCLLMSTLVMFSSNHYFFDGRIQDHSVQRTSGRSFKAIKRGGRTPHYWPMNPCSFGVQWYDIDNLTSMPYLELQKPTNLQSTVSERLGILRKSKEHPLAKAMGGNASKMARYRSSFQTSTVLVSFVFIVLSGLALTTYHAVTCGVTITPRRPALFTHPPSIDAHKSQASGARRYNETEPDCWTFCLVNACRVGIRRRSKRGRYAQVKVYVSQPCPSIGIGLPTALYIIHS